MYLMKLYFSIETYLMKNFVKSVLTMFVYINSIFKYVYA